MLVTSSRSRMPKAIIPMEQDVGNKLGTLSRANAYILGIPD